LFLVAGIISLLMGFTATLLWICGDDLGVQFSPGESGWRMSCRFGRIWLDNAPALRKATEARPQEETLRRTLQKEPRDGPGYRKALDELKSVVAARVAAASHFNYVEYSFPLWPLMLAGVPGILWLASPAVYRAVRFNERHLPHLSRTIRFQARRKLFTVGSAVSLLLCIATIWFWGRSYSSRTAASTITVKGEEFVIASERGTFGIDNRPQIEQFLARRSTQMRSLTATVERETESALFVRGILRAGRRSLIRVNSRWLGVGESIESDGVRIEIENISPRQIAIVRNGERVARRMNESLKMGMEGNRRIASLRAQLAAASAARPPRLDRRAIPYWMIAACFAILPAAWLAGLARRQSRLNAGGCIACGYNLTGNTSGVCPECGTPVEEKAAVES
jgi:hypothetical protein